MRYFILYFAIIAGLMASLSSKADQKAEDEAVCEAKCQSDATAAYKQCKDVDECKSYVQYSFGVCMKDCDK